MEALAKWPELPSLTLARKLYENNPELYTSLDAARASIRYYRGTIGK
jgi:hypothetical protein